MIGTWLASVILFIFSFAFQIPNYSNDSSIISSSNFDIENELVKIRYEDYESDDDFMVNVGPMHINQDGLYGSNIEVKIYKSDSSYVSIEKEIESQGRTKSNARKYAKQVNINEKVKDNTIYIPEFYRINKGDKFRGQHIKYKIYIPKDKRVEVARSMKEYYTVRYNEFERDDD